MSTHDDRTLAVNSIRCKLGDFANFSIEVSSRGNSSSLLNDQRHRDSFIQHPKLAFRALLIGGINVDSSVKKGSVNVRNHRTNVASTVRLAFDSVLECIDCILDRLVPVDEVSLVAGVDPLSSICGELHVEPGMNELPNRWVETEALNGAVLESEDKLDSRRVSAVSSADAFFARSKEVFHYAILLLEDAENSTNGYIAVNVG
mmetsp:Transcript_31402/g.74955  ORF Transcript_31402/g.74955 Transcript_31402/m.74955 type:complete len:203 (+) Transcript_31402:262-870(+)